MTPRLLLLAPEKNCPPAAEKSSQNPQLLQIVEEYY
jgi:hypothetical protein